MDLAVKMVAVGGPDQLKVFESVPQQPGPQEIRLRHEAIGVNFIDIYHRIGLYPLSPPAVLGVEGAGIVEAVGEGVDSLTVGDRVVYAGAQGAYATTRLLPAWRAIRLPETIPSRIAATSIMRGLTTHMLLTRTYPVEQGTVLLVHAAAGGLGSMLTRWAKDLGARVIGTASSAAKAEIARKNDADHVIVGREADVIAEVSALTDGRGVDFAIDGIGGTMLRKTLACVRRFGTVASVGQAAGPIPPIAVDEIGPVRALSLARPSVMAYAADRQIYPAAVEATLRAIENGIRIEIGGEYTLAEAAKAQADLEAGHTVGSLLLIP
jgi:NADPH2:quinone reductase